MFVHKNVKWFFLLLMSSSTFILCDNTFMISTQSTTLIDRINISVCVVFLSTCLYDHN